MNRLFGCNTLYPYGRLQGNLQNFNLPAQQDSLRLISQAGLDGCEFSHYSHLKPYDQEKLGQTCRELNLEAWSAHAKAHLPAHPGRVVESLPLLQTELAGAARLGARVMVVHPERDQTGDDEQRYEALAAVLHALAPAAENAGMVIGIENCADRRDLQSLVAVLDRLALPTAGFTIDTGHTVLRGMQPDDAIRLMGSRLVSTHLQDNHGELDDHLPPGRGSLPWNRIRSALDDIGYRGMLMVEISDNPPQREAHPREETAAARDFLRRLFA